MKKDKETKIDVQLFVVPSPPAPKSPEWKRSAGLSSDGKVFVPAAIFGDENMVSKVASFDGVPYFVLDGHWFVPADWMTEKFPSTKTVCMLIKSKIK